MKDINNIEKIETKDITVDNTLSIVKDLTKFTNEAINAYSLAQPIYNELTSKVLETIQSDVIFDNLDTEDMMKLLTITSKNQLQPIQELTKLVTQINNLHERLDATKEIEKLRTLVEELRMERSKEISLEAEYEETKVPGGIPHKYPDLDSKPNPEPDYSVESEPVATKPKTLEDILKIGK